MSIKKTERAGARRKRRCRPWLQGFALALALGAAAPASATNKYFDCISGSLRTAGCWVPSGIPTGTDTAFVGYASFANNVTATLTTGTFAPQYEFIGYSGYNGTVNHSGGTNGSPTATYIISIGYGAGLTGTYNLSGTGVVNAGNTMEIGYYGTGVFTQTGGSNTVPTYLYLGAWSAASNGSYDLQSGTLTVSDPLVSSQEIIGLYGTGNFTQSGGTHTAESISMAVYAGSNGTYNLSGGNLNPGNLYFNGAGTASFTHSGGTNQVAGNLYLAAYGAGSAAYNLSGSASLTVGSLTLGGQASNVFTQTGGTHTVNSNFQMGGFTAGNSGTYHLRGGTLGVGGSGIQNQAGTGTLNIDGGALTVGGGNGSINVDNLVLGSLFGYTGSHTLSGTGTLTAGNETIGNSGAGSFTQSGGTHNVTNTLSIAANAGSSGTFHMQGGSLSAGAIVNKGMLNFSGGTLNAPVNNTGNMNLSGAGTRTLSGAVTNNGTVNVAGGTTAQFDGQFSGAGGITGGGTSVFNGGLSPGNSPALVNVAGDTVFGSGNVFAVEIGGLTVGTEYDRLAVGGSASLAGTLDVSLIDLGFGVFAPQAGDFFDILTAEILSGSFGTVNFAALIDPNLNWQLDYLIDAVGSTDVVRLSVTSIASVPIPGAAWLFASGLAGLGALTRRKARGPVRIFAV